MSENTIIKFLAFMNFCILGSQNNNIYCGAILSHRNIMGTTYVILNILVVILKEVKKTGRLAR